MVRKVRAAGVSMAVLVAVTSCTVDEGGESPAETVPTLAPTSTVEASTTTDGGGLLAALGAIDPGLRENREQTLRRAESTCQEIEAGKSEATIVESTRQRFDGGGGGSVQIDSAEAAAIVAVLRAHGCP